MNRARRPFAILSILFTVLLSPLAQSAPKLNGAGIHYAVTEEIYIAAIYLESPAKTANDALGMKGAKRMEMRVVAESLRSRAFATLWLQLININNTPEEVTAFTSEIQQFSNVLEDKLEFGDALSIDLKPGSGVTVSIDGVPVQRFEKDAFFNILLRCWIGSRSPSNEFTRNLLGLGAENADIVDRFNVTLPATGRKQAIAAWASATTLAAAAPKTVAKAEPPKPAAKPASSRPEPVAAPAKPEPVAAAPAPAETVPAAPPALAEPAPAPVAEAAPAKPEPAATPAPKPAAPAPVAVAAAAAPAAGNGEAEEAGEDSTEEATAVADEETLRKTHRAYILRDTYKKVRYPQSAASRNQEGEVVVTVTIKRDGTLAKADVTTRSYPALNAAAEKAVEEAAPFTPAPDELPGDSFTYELPIKFKVPR